ncbi:hypothetical protein [Sporolactobacillus sp. KGMB 08714]|uniref:hypothetical protein n=1 Tax=Sporolactobacillus sp. KGMB 08714 TaxID=3064704 RepID=UPI002FBEA00C
MFVKKPMPALKMILTVFTGVAPSERTVLGKQMPASSASPSSRGGKIKRLYCLTKLLIANTFHR